MWGTESGEKALAADKKYPFISSFVSTRILYNILYVLAGKVREENAFLVLRGMHQCHKLSRFCLARNEPSEWPGSLRTPPPFLRGTLRERERFDVSFTPGSCWTKWPWRVQPANGERLSSGEWGAVTGEIVMMQHLGEIYHFRTLISNVGQSLAFLIIESEG